MGGPRSIVAQILSCLISLNFVACSGRYSQPSDKEYLPQKPGSNATSPTTPDSSQRIFRGSIGGKYPIQMTLMRGDGGALSGSYFYESKRSDLRLEGTINDKNEFVLSEYGGGNRTGIFKGRWRDTDYEPEAILEGDWSMPNGSQQSPFYLIGQHINPGSPLKLSAIEIREENKKHKFSVEALYPQLEGAADPGVEEFNQRARNLVTNAVTNWKSDASVEPGGKDLTPDAAEDSFEINYIVRASTDAIISIEFDFDEYSHGAAHPSHSFQVLTLDLKTGRLLKLSDLFKAGTNYLSAISIHSIEQLRRWNKDSAKESGDSKPYLDDPEFLDGAKPTPKNYRIWTLTPNGLAITFDYYQLGSYAAGAPAILIPYAKLKDLLDDNSPASSFWR